MTTDLLVIGGGAIGLSIAWCAARRGARVVLLERGALARQSSWAAAGILPFGLVDRATTPYARAMAESWQLHHAHAQLLQEETSIDVGHRVCGEILVALSAADQPALHQELARRRAAGATVEAVIEPSISHEVIESYRIRETAQIRPPRYLRALERACRQRGVTLHTDTPVASLLREGARVIGARTTSGAAITAATTVIATGAWAPSLAPAPLDVRPLRGQMVLLALPEPVITPIVSRGSEYLVPREDGLVLCGATMEDVGFDDRTTADAIAHLHALAVRLVPALTSATVEQTWAGLRPATPSGEPHVERLEDGLWLAAGHTRQGIHLAPYTGETIARAVL